MQRIRASLLLFSAIFAAAPAGAQQEPPASQRAAVSQTINTTLVTLTYDRPVARGRVLFGDAGVVKFDTLWTAGANRATIVEVDRGVRIAGQRVPAGKYSLWTIPGDGDWTFILNRTWDAHHAQYPGAATDVLRVTLTPQSGAHMEALAYYFPVVGPYTATLHLHWGGLVLAIPIEVER
ncbi:MAG TPA: DUF2911 domain-containing protein [Longimicrobiales bacterium]|nr:DUF2911 domain-containing protein [Longimicrobiales bacterium]